MTQLLMLSNDAEIQSAEAINYGAGPASEASYQNLARNDAGKYPPIRLRTLKKDRDACLREPSPALGGFKLTNVETKLIKEKAPPSAFAMLERLEECYTRTFRPGWQIPKVINFRIATDPEGMTALDKRVENMMN